MRRILVAEDHEMDRHGLRAVLEEYTDWASSGEPDATPAKGTARLKFDQLTPGGQQILQLIAEGLSATEVATRLEISLKTAQTCRVNVIRELEIQSASEVVHYAFRNRIAAL